LQPEQERAEHVEQDEPPLSPRLAVPNTLNILRTWRLSQDGHTGLRRSDGPRNSISKRVSHVSHVNS
jgi:hypothetical protein